MPLATVLFVCIENSNRSQMAEAFARIHGQGRVEPFSAGSRPSGMLNPKAVAVMAELGYDLTTHHSKGLSEVPQSGYKYVITMGCGDECPFIQGEHREDWDLADTTGRPLAEFVRLREEIESRVIQLLDRV
jgi:arsenate reductase